MCFSAASSFMASAVIGSIGVATLRHVREPRALLFAAVPMLFSVHQFSEGFVWLGLDGRIGKVAFDHVTFLFMLYAQGILPLLMPAAVLLMEPRGWRRRAILGLTGIGALVCAWDVYGLVSFPSQAVIDLNSIAYRNPATDNFDASRREGLWPPERYRADDRAPRPELCLRVGLVLLCGDHERDDLSAIQPSEHRYQDPQRDVADTQAVPVALAAGRPGRRGGTDLTLFAKAHDRIAVMDRPVRDASAAVGAARFRARFEPTGRQVA
jgi:hypothetical protein